MPNRSFLEKMQALEEPAKTRVVIVTTIILMIIVIYFWLAYFGGIVSGPTQATISGQGQPVPVAQPSP